MARYLLIAMTVILTQAAAAEPPSVPVRDNGLVATWYPPASGKTEPAIIALGGSECGEKGSQYVAEAIARTGYGALALAYCGAQGLPEAVEDIPLEYFTKAVNWLEAAPLVDKTHIGLYGISIGGETALVVAAREPRITAVVAGSPSSVVWQGFNPRDYQSVKPTYTLDGKPVPYLPYDMSKPFISIFDLYQRSLAALPQHADAVIPVERIHGPVLLISGKDDLLWPSSAMADQVIRRLDDKGFRFAHEHIAYDNAGHGAPMPPSDASWMKMMDGLGGTPDGNAAARADAWKHIIAFFERALGKP